MRENPFVKGKRENVAMVKALIEQNVTISQAKIIGVMGVYGLTEKTVNTYLANLQDAGFIVWNGESKTWSLKQ